MRDLEEVWPKQVLIHPMTEKNPPDSQNFESLVDKYHKLVMALINRYYGGRLKDQAEDLSQEIWTKLWTAFKKNENNVINFKSYLYRTVQTTMWDAIRSQRPLADEEVLEAEASSNFGENAVHARLSVSQMLRGLKPHEARMVRAYLKGFNNGEIAELMGYSEGRVRNLLSRLKKKMAILGDI